MSSIHRSQTSEADTGKGRPIVCHGVLLATWLCLFANVAHAQTTIVGDTFTGANGVALTAHAPETNPLSRAWAVSGSPTPTLQNNRVAVTSGSNYVTAFIDGGTPDVTVSTTFVAGANPAAGSNMATLVFRRTDANNYLLFRRYNYGVSLWCVANGTWTLLASDALEEDLAPGSTHTLSAVLSGSTIRALWDNGVRVLTVTNTTHIAATQYGVQWLASYDSVTTYDYFGVTGVLAAPAHHTDVSPGPGSVVFREGLYLTAAAKDSNNAVIPNTAFRWSTSNAAIASVTPQSATTAFVTGTGVGNMTITATPTRGIGGASAVTVNPGNFILFDDFSGADATALTAHAPTVNLAGAAWAITGTPTPVLSGQAAAVTNGSGWVSATTDGTIPDVLVETDWTPGSNPAGGMSVGALIFRRSDANNYFLLQWANGHLILYRVAAGVWTNRWQADFDSAILAGTHHLSAQATGSSIQVMWDRGVYVGNVTDSFNLTATHVGVQWVSIYDARATYDNFSVRGSLPPWANTVTVTPSPATVVFHEGTTVTAHAYDAVGAPITNMAFTWATSDANVFQVTPTAAATAFIAAVGPGSATITATPTHGPNGTTVASVNLGTYVVYDSFIASDGSLLSAHAPEVNQPGGSWVVTGGPAPRVTSQRAAVASGSSAVTAIIEGWVPNVTASVLWTPGANPAGGSNYSGLVFRRSDANNYFLLQYWNRWLQLWRVHDGVWTQTWAWPFDEEPSLQSHPLAVQLAGSQIQVLWGNALLDTLTDSFNSNATQYGLQWSSLYDATSTYDNFSITGTLPAVPTTVVVTPTNPAIGFNTGRWAEAHAYDAVGAEIPGVVFRWTSSAPSIVLATAQAANTGYLVGIGTGSSTITAQATRGGPTGSTIATVDLGSTLVYDSFQGSNGTGLTTHVPEVAQLGGSWRVTGGNGASVVGGRAVANATTSADIVTALFETNMPNGTLDVLWRTGTTVSANAFGGLIFRATDSLNFFYLEYWGQSVQLWKRAPSGFERVAGGDVDDPGLAAHHLGVTLVGSTIQVNWDGVVLFTANDAFNQGATSAGLVWFPIYDPNASYDTFSVTGTLPPAVTTMTVTALPASLAPYSTQALTAVTLDGSAQPIADAAVKFVSSDNAVATVVQTGPRTALVTAIANGSVTITTTVPRGPAPVARSTTVSTCVDPLSTSAITWDYQARTGATIAVTAPAGCSWTAFSLDAWLSVTAGAAGSGSRTVTYAFSENVGSTRTGRLILGGRVYSVVQPAKPCHMDLTPGSATAGSGGGTFSFDVSTTGSCAWTAMVAQPAAWLHTSSSGVGEGSATYVVDPYNNMTQSRAATIHVGDAAFVVTQGVDGTTGGDSGGPTHPSTLTAGQTLTSLMSPDGRYQFTYQSDGNIVLLQGTTGLWSSGTSGPGYAVMQTDGNFVRYYSDGRASWHTNTGGHPGAYLKVQSDGQVVIRDVDGSQLWSTAPGDPGVGIAPTADLTVSMGYEVTGPATGGINTAGAVSGGDVTYKGGCYAWASYRIQQFYVPPIQLVVRVYLDGVLVNTRVFTGLGYVEGTAYYSAKATPSPQSGRCVADANFGFHKEVSFTLPAAAPTPPGTGIWVKSHALPPILNLLQYFHTSLRLTPVHQAYWVSRYPEYFKNKDEWNNYFATIGAGPSQDADIDMAHCSGDFHLFSNINRPSDIDEPPQPMFEHANYNVAQEDQLVETLLNLAVVERGGYADDLWYFCYPSLGSGFNSNSFTAGLLNAVDLAPPAFALTHLPLFPGWEKPVPSQYFQR